MLLHNRAIFGALAFHDDRIALLCAAEMERRGRRLGAMTTLRHDGGVVLGVASRTSSVQFDDGRDRGRVPVVMAGEIVNRGDLALELTGNARSVATDAGLLARAYEAWDLRCLSRLDGAFAAAIWDDRHKRLLLSCDHQGAAHLYYHVAPDRLVFSSWLPLLSDLAKGIDRGAAKEFLRFLYISSSRTLYEGISRLTPGEYLVAAGGQVSTNHLPPHLPGWSDVDLSRRDARDLVTTFEELLLASVRRRVGDRRVGVLLSGGIDSATLTAACHKACPGQVETFTVAFDDPNLDESGVAEACARHLSLRHHCLRFDFPTYRRAFDAVVRGFDLPFADPASLPILLACEAGRDRVDLFVDGTGADGLFGAPIPRHLRFSLAVSAHFPDRARALLTHALRRVPIARLRGCAPLFDFDDIEELFVTWPGWSRKEVEGLLGEATSFDETRLYRTFREWRDRGPQELYNALWVLPPDDCRFEAAGVVGLPMHLPYHDRDLRGFVHRLPAHYRRDRDETKILLRRLFTRYYPQPFWGAKKHYFNFPVHAFLARRNYEIVRDYLAPDRIARHGIVDPGGVAPWIRRYLGGDHALAFKVWALMLLQRWLDTRA